MLVGNESGQQRYGPNQRKCGARCSWRRGPRHLPAAEAFEGVTSRKVGLLSRSPDRDAPAPARLSEILLDHGVQADEFIADSSFVARLRSTTYARQGLCKVSADLSSKASWHHVSWWSSPPRSSRCAMSAV